MSDADPDVCPRSADPLSESPLPAVPAWDRRHDRRAALALFLTVWVVFLSTATYWVGQMNDTRATTQSAWSLGTRGTLALPEHWRGEIDWEVEGRDGRPYTNRFPGPTLWAAPFHALGEALFPRPVPDHPHLLNYAPSGVAAATAAALSVLVSFLIFRRLAARRLSVGAALVLAFGTGVWSVSASAMWPHTVTHLTLALGVLAASESRDARSGLLFGAALLSRPHLAVVPAVVGLWKGAESRTLRPIVVVGLTSALGLAAVVLYSRELFGTWLPIAGYNSYAVDNLGGTTSVDYARRIALTFVDPARGVFIYSPFLLALVPFIRRGWSIAPWWVRASALSGVAYLLLQLRVNAHHGGSQFFGSRLTLETLVLLAPLLLLTWRVAVSRFSIARRVSTLLVALSVTIHLLGSTVWATPFYDNVAVWAEHLDDICSESNVAGCPSRGVPGQ